MAQRSLVLFLLLGSLSAQSPADDGKAAQEALSGWTKMSNAQKSAAIERAVSLNTPQAAHQLATKLHDKEPIIRKEIATALGKLKDEKTVPQLLSALEVDADDKTGDVDAFVAICKALGEIGDARAIQPLVHGVLSGNRTSKNWQTRGDARIEALGGIKHKDAIDELMGLWQRGAASNGRSAGGAAGGSVRGSSQSRNPFAASIAASLNKLTGQNLTDQKAYHDWWKDNKDRFKFAK